MPAFHLNSLPKEKRIQMIGEFYDVIDSLKNRDEVRFFFKSLLTPEEIAMFMRRVEIAVLLSAKFTHEDISEKLGVSFGKISAVQKSLQQDDNGYKIIIKRLVEERKKRLKKNKKIDKDMAEGSSIKRFSASNRILPNLIDTVIEKLEDDKELEKEALLFTPSCAPFKNKKIIN